MIIFLATLMSTSDQAASLCKVGKMERLLSYFYIVSTKTQTCNDLILYVKKGLLSGEK